MIVVAGHLCLDIIPKIHSDTALEPGTLVDVGPADLATGGAVSNVGTALHKLGAQVRLVGKIGDDAFAKIVLAQFESLGLAGDIQIAPGSVTSYSVVVSPPNTDRIFLHCPGCNDSFISSDVPDSALIGASHFHFGYPPLMAAMRADDGLELVSLFQRAKRLGLSTSLDMSLPDKNSDQGKTNWTQLLTNVLPYVDFFMPSEEELAFMLPQVVFGIEELARTCLNLGCGVIVIKRGTDGLFAQSASAGRLEAIAKYSDPNTWSSQRLTQAIFPVEVVGTTGAGDATIAGFLYGLVKGQSFQQCLAAGCMVGAMSVEGVDSVSGIKSWSEACTRF